MKKLLLFFTMFAVAVMAVAVPARRQSFTNKQSDGTTIVVTLAGDEAFHYYVTMDNIPVVKNADGDFCYATLTSEGNLVSTDCLAHNSGMRSYAEQTIIDTNDFSGMRSQMKRVAARRAAVYDAPRKSQTIRPQGVINIPVILVEFADEKFTFSKEDIAPKFNGVNYTGPSAPYLQNVLNITSTMGSVRDYFVAQSDGKFQPNFVVTDIVTLDKNMSYYGGNDTSGNDDKPQQMIIDACNKLDGTVDFSIFDNDGDGTVEFLYCVYAGYAESAGADESTIWPHQWYLSAGSSTAPTLDNVVIDNYACSSELEFSETDIEQKGENYANNISGIGTCCHEFSHCLGLPDFYDTSGSSNPPFGMDCWDLMDYGSYNLGGYVPIGYSAYERDFMEWRTLQEIDTKGRYSMEAITSGGIGYKVVNSANSNEYYIIECRRQENWDTYTPASGVMITHVDYSSSVWYNNEVNNDPAHQRFTLIPADGALTVYGTVGFDAYKASLKGDLWPGTSGNTALTDTSTPAAKVFKGGYMGKPITNITYENGVASFVFMASSVDAPVALDATEITTDAFTANWTSVGDAEEYIVTLEQVTESDNENTLHSLLTEDFIKCVKTNLSVNAPDDYFSNSGWSVVNCYTETGAMRIGSSSNKGSCETPVIKETGRLSLSFKSRLFNSSDTGAVLTVILKNNTTGEESELLSLSAVSDWNTYEVAFTADSDFTLLFSTANSTGKRRVSIDDVVLSLLSKESATLVENVTTTDTSYTFTGLTAGAKYRYSVKAYDALDVESLRSNYVYVTLLSTGIDDVRAATTEFVTVYSSNGNVVYSGLRSSMPELPRGIYIVRCGDKVEKVVKP